MRKQKCQNLHRGFVFISLDDWGCTQCITAKLFLTGYLGVIWRSSASVPSKVVEFGQFCQIWQNYKWSCTKIISFSWKLTKSSRKSIFCTHSYKTYWANFSKCLANLGSYSLGGNTGQYCWGYSNRSTFEGTLLPRHGWYSCHNSRSVPSECHQWYSDFQ